MLTARKDEHLFKDMKKIKFKGNHYESNKIIEGYSLLQKEIPNNETSYLKVMIWQNNKWNRIKTETLSIQNLGL